MDTSSHLCMGVATGLVINNIATNNHIEINETSIIAVSMIANVFPDIDVIFKLKSNQSYIKNHRAMSHSILFSLLWIIIITFFGYYSVHSNFYIYLISASLGITLHIFTDLLNGYGVQFLWPFKRKWIALGITYTFDSVFITLHIIAILLIVYAKLPSLNVIIIAYIILGLYLIFSYIYHYFLKKALIKKYGRYKRLILQAKSLPINWKYVYETNDKKFYMGIVRFKTIIQLRYEKRLEILSNELEEILLNNKNVKTFMDFTPIFNYHIHHRKNDSLEIRFYDLRYLMVRKNSIYYSFNCIVNIKDNKVVSSYLGFTIKENKAEEKYNKINKKMIQD